MNEDTLAPSHRDDFLHNLAYAMCRWKFAIVGIFLLLVVMVFFAGYLMTPSWQAKVYLLAEPTSTPARSAFPDPTRQVQRQSSDFYGQHVVRILQGKEMALAIVDKFDLAERARRRSEEPANLREVVWASVFNTLGAVIDTTLLILTGKQEEKAADWRDEAAGAVREGLTAWVEADLVTETDIVELLVNGETPELANEIASFMIDHLRTQLAAIAATGGDAAVAAFRVELDNTIQRQEAAERLLQDFVEANKGVQPADLSRIKMVDLARLQSELGRLISERAELERQREDRDGATAGATTSGGASDRILRNVSIQQLQSRRYELRITLATLLSEVTAAHPDVLSTRTQLRQTESELDAAFDNVMQTVDAELRSKRQEITDLEMELAALPTLEFEYTRLATNVEIARQLRRDLQAHVEALSVTAQSGIGSLAINVLERAYVSPVATPDMPSWMIVALVALVFAGGVAVVIPPFVEYWRDPIRGPVDLLAHGVTPLAVIPDFGRPDVANRAGAERESA